RKTPQLERQQRLGLGEKLVETPAIEQVFETRRLAVGAVAMGDEDAKDGDGDVQAFLRREQHASVASKVAVPGDAAEQQAEIDARRDGFAIVDGDGGEADIVGVLEHGDLAAAIEG